MESKSGGRRDWRVKLGGAVGCLVGISIARYVIFPLVDLPGWWGMIVFVALAMAGIALGQIAGRRLSRQLSD